MKDRNRKREDIYKKEEKTRDKWVLALEINTFWGTMSHSRLALVLTQRNWPS